MSLLGRITFLVACIGVCAIHASLPSAAFAQPATEELPRSWLNDVELTDVYFHDTEKGWAVGDHGTVLKTTDGGKTWKQTANLSQITAEKAQVSPHMQRVLQHMQRELGQNAAPVNRTVPNGINYRFESVHFADAMNGLVVGGYDLPYVKRSRAVVLKTKDGGETWKVIQGLVIPKLRKVHMDNELGCWAIGDTGNLFQCGWFNSTDGGENWFSVTNIESPPFTDGDMAGPTMVAVTTGGAINKVIGSNNEKAQIHQQAGRASHDIRELTMLDAETGWAVGYQSQLLQTADGGAQWHQYLSKILDTDTKFDFHTITSHGEKIWFAGNPGTYIFSLDLQDGKIEKHRTPISNNINRIFFASPTHGWAVGDGGNLLATTDGGSSWQSQRTGTQRVGLLTVCFSPESFGGNLLAMYACDKDIASANLYVDCQNESGDNSNRDFAHRMTQASSRLGCNINQRLAMGPSATIESIQRQIARSIRALKPNVVACETASFRLADGSYMDAHQILDGAIQMAKDRFSCTDQLIEMGLTPWRVDRLAVLEPSGIGNMKLNNDRFLPIVAKSIECQAAISFALLDQPICKTKDEAFRVNSYTIAKEFRGADLFEGLAQRGKQIPIRTDKDTRRGNLHAMQANVKRRKQMIELAQWNDARDASMLVWRQHLNTNLTGVDNDLSGVWLTDLANLYLENGQSRMAAFAFSQLAERYPRHPLSPAAIIWLAQYHASDEMLAARMAETKTETDQDELLNDDEIESLIHDSQIKQANYQTTPQVVQSDGVQMMIWVPDQVKNEFGSQAPEIDPLTESLQLASSIVTRIRARDPDLAKDKYIRFLEAKLTSRSHNRSSATNLFKKLVNDVQPSDPLFTAGGREIQLALGNDAAPRMTCGKIKQRPTLDGELTDSCWNQMNTKSQIQFLDVTSKETTEAVPPDAVAIGYDDEFLYIAARCNKQSGFRYNSATDKPRTRDAEISRFDRIEFTLDSDRDYCSFIHFEVDYRGWCREGSGGSLGWNTDWFIAQSSDEHSWSIELAIPLDSLTAAGISKDTAWGVSLARRLGADTPNLWPTPDLPLQNRSVGLHEVSTFNSEAFQLMEFETAATESGRSSEFKRIPAPQNN